MFDEPDEAPEGRPASPTDQAKEKSDEFRMHAELAAIFEGGRKFDAEFLAGLDQKIARDCQKSIGKLEKLKIPDTPVVGADGEADATRLLDIPNSEKLTTNDYHIARRPGEVFILRWLAGEQVESFYKRLQAHFDAALNHYKEDERQSKGWKQDPTTTAYLEALDAIDLKMPERYLRPVILEDKVFVLSTQSADEMDISHLCDFIMGVPAAEIVGEASAPPPDPTEQDRAWYFKCFSLRGVKGDEERMLFFTYLQKTDESF